MKNISVIIPVYNAEKYIDRCVQSLILQTLENIEFIFVNDCSTDTSLKILTKYQEEYPETIKVLSLPKNMRQGAARNAGIKIAQGEYLGFVDADDWVDEKMFEKLYQCAKENNYDVVGCHNYVANASGKVISISKGNTVAQTGILNEERRKSLLVNGGNIWLKIYRRSMLVDNQIYFPEKLSYEDNYFIPLVFLHCKSFGLVDEPLYYYYLSENSTVRTSNSNTQFQRFKTLALLMEKVKELGVYEKYKVEFEYLEIVLYYLNTAKLCVIHYKPYNIEMLFKIPVYNTKTDLMQQCVDSVVCCSDIELIIVNDGSTDMGVVQMCESYAMQYDNIQYVSQANSGPSVTRNNGIAKARGEYIIFLDSDDWWNSGVFEKICKVLNKWHPDVLVFQAEKVEFTTGERLPIGKVSSDFQQWSSGKEALKSLLAEDLRFEWYAWKYVFSKNLFERTNLRFEKGLYYEDVDLIPRLLYNAEMTICVPDVLLNYRFHNPTSILNTPNIKKSNDKLLVVNRMMDFCLKIDDTILKKQLLHNLSQLFLSAYGDYINDVPVDVTMLKRSFGITKYSEERLGKVSRICCGLFGLQNGTKLIRKLLKK